MGVFLIDFFPGRVKTMNTEQLIDPMQTEVFPAQGFLRLRLT